MSDFNLGTVTAYGYAKDKGYTGTEDEYAELMASYADVAEQAAESAEHAAASATTATAKASEAAQSATAAASSKTAAETAQGGAETAAQTATTKAGEATTAATTATNKATEATTAATTATGKATEAAGSATTATTKAGEASTSATNAAASATRAQEILDSIPEDYSQLTEDVSNLKEDLDDVETALETKAEIDGYYEDMTVGDAEQLVSTVTNADDTPYNFRTTAGSADVGDRAYVDAIVGGTLCVNQLVPDDQKDSTNVGVESSNVLNFLFRLNNTPYTIFFSKQSDANAFSGNFAFIARATATGNAQILHNGLRTQVVFANNIPVIDSHLYLGKINFTSTDITVAGGIVAKDTQISDLTATFGTTIADYIYSLETATIGAGVAWLKANAPKIFNGGYIPFNAGTLQSVVGLSEKRNTGLNQFDKSKATVGSFVNTGGNVETDSACFVTDFIRVVPNTAYYTNHIIGTGRHTCAYVEYDSNKNVVSWSSAGAGNDKTLLFTTGASTNYIRVNVEATYLDATNINLHWDGEKDGIYEPYTVHTYAFDPTVELRGVPKLKDGKMYFDGDRYLPDGTVNRRYAEIIFDGSDDETITAGTSGMTFRIYLPSDAIINTDSSEMTNTFATYLTQVTQQSTWGKEWTFSRTANQRSVYFKLADDLTDISTLRTYLAQHPLIFVYELATPTTETAEPYQHVQICDDFGTEEFVSTSPVPVGHNTRYAPNLRAKLEMSPDSPDGDGLYIVQQSGGENTYIPLASSATIQSILARLTALEGNTNEG